MQSVHAATLTLLDDKATITQEVELPNVLDGKPLETESETASETSDEPADKSEQSDEAKDTKENTSSKTVVNFTHLWGGVSGTVDTSASVMYLDGGTATTPGDFNEIAGVQGTLDVEAITFRGKVNFSGAATNLSNFFIWAINAKNINGLENMNISNVTNLSGMFSGLTKLESLDLSSWNTQGKSVAMMLYGTKSLKKLKLGTGFQSLATVNLSNITSNSQYSGKWRNVGTGTETAPNGSNIWTSSQFMSNYNPAKDADTYVWQAAGDTGGGGTNPPPATSKIFGNVSYIYDSSVQELTLTGGDITNTTNWDGIDKTVVKKIFFTGKVTVSGNSLKYIFADMPEVTNIEGLENLDYSRFRVTGTGSMVGMFANDSKLEALDLSTWDTNPEPYVDEWNRYGYGVVDLFKGTTSLKKLILGDFAFLSEVNLPDVPNNDKYTGYWAAVKEGTEDNPAGNPYTSFQFMNGYNALTNAGWVWVWQPRGADPSARKIFGNVSYTYDTSTQTVTLTGGDITDPTDWSTVDRSTIKQVTFTGTVTVSGKSLVYMFQDTSALESVDNASYLDTTGVTNFSYMFMNAISLKTVDVSTWNTSAATTMANMFAHVYHVTNLDVSKWDTSKVTNMNSMFVDTYDVKTLNVSNWNTSQVTLMGNLFNSSKTIEELDLSKWDTSKANVVGMFGNTDSLRKLTLGLNFKTLVDTEIPDIVQPDPYTGKWQNIGTGTETYPDGDNVWTSVEFMANFNPLTDAGTYIWQKTTKIWGAVTYDYNKTTQVLTLHGGTISNINDWANVDKTQLKRIVFTEELGVTFTNSSKEISLASFFKDMGNLESVDNAHYLNTSGVTDFRWLFQNCTKLKSVDVSTWDTSSVKQMGYTFAYAENLESLDVSKWNTSKVEMFEMMFASCKKIKVLDLSNWDTRRAQEAQGDVGCIYMFFLMDSLQQLSVGENVLSGNIFVNSEIPKLEANDLYTGYWQNVGSGTVDDPKGEHIWTSGGFLWGYDSSKDADTYVWQKVHPVNYINVTIPTSLAYWSEGDKHTNISSKEGEILNLSVYPVQVDVTGFTKDGVNPPDVTDISDLTLEANVKDFDPTEISLIDNGKAQEFNDTDKASTLVKIGPNPAILVDTDSKDSKVQPPVGDFTGVSNIGKIKFVGKTSFGDQVPSSVEVQNQLKLTFRALDPDGNIWVDPWE